jgi:UDP-N-acetylbacillosamine N-acetyltransferase
MTAGSRRLWVLGAGGHGKVVADVARSAGFALAGFIDDAPSKDGAVIWGLPVVAWERFVAQRSRWADAVFALGVGENATRERCKTRLGDAGLPVVTVAHASSVIAPTATIGIGTVVMAGAVVNPDAAVGEGCIINTGAVVEHDCRLASFVHLSPNAALGGCVTIGARSHLGLGAVALPGTTIGADVRVGAGAVVHRPVPDGLTVAGVPARPLAKGRQP